MSESQEQQGVPDSAWLNYREGTLFFDGVALPEIASAVDTPCYVYSAAAIDAAFEAIDQAMGFAPHLITYAIKANANQAILKRLAGKGCGADIVSLGELERALRAGFAPEHIVFSGVGKRGDEISAAIEAGVRAIHVENTQELDLIESLTAEKNQSVAIALRINPDVDAQTHPYIATGLQDSKFGMSQAVAESLLSRLIDHPQLRLESLAMHIGSQLASPAPLREATEILTRFALACRKAGAPLRSLDVGGGWPMNYGDEATPFPPHAAFGDAIREGLEAAGASLNDFELVTEPGRALVGDAGVLLTRVLYTKDQGDKRFVIVDAAMTELIRPALYGAYHAIMPAKQADPNTPLEKVDIVGPVCESGDFIAQARALPPIQPCELLVVRGAGAYGREMASMYNARLPAAEVLIEGDQWRIVRQRPSLETLWLSET